MRVILAADAIFPPLTGIGRYTAELASGLGLHPAVETVQFYAQGRWLADPLAALQAAAGAQPAVASGRPADSPAVPPLARLRTLLASNTLAVRAYGALAPRVASWRLRRCQDHLFHSPNYMLPPFPGRCVSTIHDLSTLLYPHFHPAARVAFMDRALPAAVAQADRIITPSVAVREELIAQLGVEPQRVRAIAMGVDPAYAPQPPEQLARALAPYSLPVGQYVLCVATMEPRKNIDALLDAYERLPAALQARHPLVLAGAPGWNSEPLQARVRVLAQRGTLHHLGYVPEALLPALYAGARLFAFPALYEGFGLPVLEAMASGTPVITSDCSSLPEVAGDAALLVTPQDVPALTSALLGGLEDEVWREQARARGLARAAGMRWQHCVDATVALYEELAV